LFSGITAPDFFTFMFMPRSSMSKDVRNFFPVRFFRAARQASRWQRYPLIVGGVFALTLIGATQAALPVNDAKVLEAITQEMADAVAPGNKAVWDRYLDANALYVDENNEVKTKSMLLAEFKPLPPGFSGMIKIIQFRVQFHPGVAVTTYVHNETEDVQGQVLRNQFRETDTWRKTGAGWRLIAAQVLAIPKDPPETHLSVEQLAEYAGTYSMSKATQTIIRVADGALIAERADRPARTMKVELRDIFFTPGRPRERRIFTRDSAGVITGFVDRREGEDLVWRRQGK